MNSDHRTWVRLSSFALILLGTFGSAYAIGERLPGHDHGSTVPPHQGHGSGGEYELVTEHVTSDAASFHLRDASGATVTEFVEAHGARLHAVVIRPDLSDFHHVHPQIDNHGSWTVTLDGPGPWHLVFEFAEVIVTTNVDDGTAIDTVPLPPADDTLEVDGLLITRDGFQFSVTNADGSAVDDLEPYLGQVAHLVALREGDLAFAHLHPHDSAPGLFDFRPGVSEPGTYRLFLQFGHAGFVVTAAFTVVVP